MTGYTASLNFPTTPGAFQPAHSGGFDAFVTKLELPGSEDDDEGYVTLYRHPARQPGKRAHDLREPERRSGARGAR